MAFLGAFSDEVRGGRLQHHLGLVEPPADVDQQCHGRLVRFRLDQRQREGSRGNSAEILERQPQAVAEVGEPVFELVPQVFDERSHGRIAHQVAELGLVPTSVEFGHIGHRKKALGRLRQQRFGGWRTCDDLDRCRSGMAGRRGTSRPPGRSRPSERRQ